MGEEKRECGKCAMEVQIEVVCLYQGKGGTLQLDRNQLEDCEKRERKKKIYNYAKRETRTPSNSIIKDDVN